MMFATMRALFVAVGERRRVIVTLDDLQWADLDSRALLAELVRVPDGPRLLLIVTQTPGGAEAPAVALPCRSAASSSRRCPRPRPTRWSSCSARGGTPLAAAAAREVVREAGGRPMFIDELVRYAGPVGGAARLEDALRDRIGRLPVEARRVLELLALAAAPLGLAATAGRGARLRRVRARARRAPRRDPGADQRAGGRVPRARARSDPRGRARGPRRRHPPRPPRRAGRGARRRGRADLAALAFHLHAAGQAREALEVATPGGDRRRGRARVRARGEPPAPRARHRHRDPHGARALEVRLGDALASAGRGGEAAVAYLAAAADAASRGGRARAPAPRRARVPGRRLHRPRPRRGQGRARRQRPDLSDHAAARARAAGVAAGDAAAGRRALPAAHGRRDQPARARARRPVLDDRHRRVDGRHDPRQRVQQPRHAPGPAVRRAGPDLAGAQRRGGVPGVGRRASAAGSPRR